jgi:hypothetical protein
MVKGERERKEDREKRGKRERDRGGKIEREREKRGKREREIVFGAISTASEYSMNSSDLMYV